MKKPTQPQLIGNIPNSTALAHYVATHPSLFEKGLFVIVAHPTDRRIVANTLLHFSAQTKTKHLPTILEWNGQTHLLPQLLQYNIIVSDQKTIEATGLPAPSILERQTLRFATGETFEFSALTQTLVDIGFERDATASRQGTFAIRGDIVDIHTDKPYRISFFGDSIEKVETLNADTMTPESTLDVPVLIAPLTSRGRSSLYDYIPLYKDILTYDTELPETVTQNRGPHTLIHAEVLALGNKMNVLGQDALFLSEHHESAGGVASKKIVHPNSNNSVYQLPKSYHLRRNDLFADISNAAQTIILAQDTQAITAFLTDNNKEPLPPHTTILHADTVGRGFLFGSDSYSSLLCLTEADIGIIERRQKKASKKLQKALMQELVPGDFVVHAHHGIARFQGITLLTVNKLPREYFVLEFAGKDKIYVPVELADRLDKYIGEEHPKLHPLSGTSWTTQLLAVQEDVARVAQELLDVYARRTTASAHHILPHAEEARLNDACPYDLTPDQTDALQNIFDDMQKDKPMDRLLCGDVGFGKTEVALRAAYRAVLNGYQVAVLAPTTILAQQHFDTFESRLKGFGVTVGQLSRFESRSEQKDVVEGLSNGRIDIVIGTHRLFSADVNFKKLGLIVIDEEQRFGVKAKETLAALRAEAHVLTMTATPIPRTLHLSLSGVRAISTILTPPNERKPVELTISPMTTQTIVDAVAREKARGGQVYYVYNRVQSIERRRIELQQLLGDDTRIGVAHGQMQPKALATVMHAFDTGEIDVLLASSIVENGLDIASANTMIVENASMFGLAELYQLKGRVGRSHAQGYAYFLYKEQKLEGDVKQRFLALQAAQGLGDGFELAMRDMEIRGVGNMLGKAQHGHASAIGLHMYVRLLNGAVEQLRGNSTRVQRDVSIDLPIEGRVPEDLVPDTEERIRLYQSIAACIELADLDDMRSELTTNALLWSDNQLHPAISGLLELIEYKILAGSSTLTSINTDYPNDTNRLQSQRITITADSPLPELPPQWERVYEGRSYEAFKARTTVAQLGDNWKQELRNSILLCAKNEA